VKKKQQTHNNNNKKQNKNTKNTVKAGELVSDHSHITLQPSELHNLEFCLDVIIMHLIYRRIQEVFMGAGNAGDGRGVDVQCCRAVEEISQLSDRRQTER